jgi:Flp pilus assembly protein TadD
MSRRASAKRAWVDEAGPEVLLESIRSLIENEDVAGARQLAAEAVALFPDDPAIQQMHRFSVRVG